MRVLFGYGSVQYVSYPYSETQTSSNGGLAASSFRDADHTSFPPELRTFDGETLFVPALQRDEFYRFCQDNRIPLRKRPDIWGYLLEGYLDEEPPSISRGEANRQLTNVGFTATEISNIQRRIGALVRS